MGTGGWSDGDKIKVMIVDDDPAIRQVLSLLLRRERDMLVVGEATDGQEALDQARAIAPDVVLMDVQMPHLDGIEATRRLKAERGEAQVNCPGVVMLTVYLDRVVEAMAAGASDCLCKACPRDLLLASIRQAAAQARASLRLC